MKCSVEWCDNKAYCKGYCITHYNRQRKGLDPNIKPVGYQSVPRGWMAANGFTRHHPFYLAWVNMKTRCNNPKSTQYPWYGARGIRVCEAWQDFINFYNDMFPEWREGLELDRKENDKDYFKENCRWTLHTTNMQNRCSNVLNHETVATIRRLYAEGTYTQTALGKRFGISQSVVQAVVTYKTWS